MNIQEKHVDTGSTTPSSLEAVFLMVAGADFNPILSSRPFDAGANPHDQLKTLARYAGLRIRKVALRDSWWRKDNGPLLGFFQDGGRPVAILPASPRRYHAYDPDKVGNVPVTSEVAETLQPFAYMLYRSFPDRMFTGKDLLLFGSRGLAPDLFMILLMGIGEALLSTLLPVVTGIIFNTIIPRNQSCDVWFLCTALLLSTGCSLMFGLTGNIAFLRVEGRMNLHVQSALWDRVLKLPLPFFRNYATGDLAGRVMGINSIRQALSSCALRIIPACTVCLGNLVLLFYFSYNLALVGVFFGLFAIIVLVTATRLRLRLQQKLAAIDGNMSGLMLGVITGIAQFRVSGGEERAFARWAFLLREKMLQVQQGRSIENVVSSLNASYPLLIGMAIFAIVGKNAATGYFSIGNFLAACVAFLQFFTALMVCSDAALSLVGIVPHYQRCRAIMDAIPEAVAEKDDPGEVLGEIEIRSLRFRYAPRMPLVLDDISFRVKPGEFVAIVGPSGSGKSTLARLLLGFEQQESGGIFYDGKNLDGLDSGLLRRKIGVVLQHGRILAGDFLTNIVGSYPLTLDHAWQAARIAGIDDDIRALPMGMHTYITEGGRNLSGGQRQRLLIARAVVMNPSILIFDEATSALDNKTQASVSKNLEQMNVTRIVIAHRLSTIIKADTILVFDKGKIIQSGTYEALLNQDGLFAEFARRQIA